VIAFVGDVHHDPSKLENILRKLPDSVSAVIQVGDLEAFPNKFGLPMVPWRPMPKPVRFICGNHHYYPDTRDLERPTEILPTFIFMPRGWVEEIEGRKIAFLGGGQTFMDASTRIEGVDWWPEEEVVSEADVARFASLDPGDVDILVTHVPPAYVSYAMTGDRAMISSERVEQVWRHLGEPELICGHMHREFRLGRVHALPMLGYTFR